MSHIPGSIWRPLSAAFIPSARMACYNRMNFHVTAGRGSPFGQFNRAGQASSHGFVYKDGTIEQFIDTDFRAEADYEGNDATLSFETEGAYPGDIANSEPWTPEQVESLAKIAAFGFSTHGIKQRLAVSSKLGEESKGLSHHRLGIDGNFPALPNPLAGRLQRGGGMHYSTSRGKLCPGDAKILQMPEILARALVILGGAPSATPISNPVVTPPTKPAQPVGPVVIAPGVIAPAYPLPRGYYFGPRSGPVSSVSGFFGHSSDLRRWQQRMHDRGWKINPDGYYGNETKGVAHDFQVEKHLEVDSLIGPDTWSHAWTEPITRG